MDNFNISLDDNNQEHEVAKQGITQIADRLESILKQLQNIKQYQIPSLPDKIHVSNLKDIPQPIMVNNVDREILSELKSIKKMLQTPPEVDKEEETPLITRVATKGSETYVGEAKTDTEEGDNKWRIQKITKIKGVTYIEWAGGTNDFSYAWKEREEYNYS